MYLIIIGEQFNHEYIHPGFIDFCIRVWYRHLCSEVWTHAHTYERKTYRIWLYTTQSLPMRWALSVNLKFSGLTGLTGQSAFRICLGLAVLRLQALSTYSQFYVGARDLNSGLCAYVASAFAHWTISSVPFSEVFWGICFLFCHLGFIMYELMISLLSVMKLEAPHMDRVDILLIIQCFAYYYI